jgi:2-polyprenyl-6-methoxyphenol hydroxylase-like FAD-dependent oxidoreductase
VGLTNFGGITRAPDLAATLEPGVWTFTFGRRAFSGLVPTPAGDVIWFVNLPRPAISAEERVRTSDAQWQEVLVDALSGDAGCAAQVVARGVLELAADNTHDLGHVPVWHDGSAVIIGDAAHAPAPSSGQGASMALEDAVALAVAVRDASSVAEALAAYEAVRRPRVERIVAMGARSSSAKVPGRLARPLLEGVMRVVFRTVASDARQEWMSGYRVSWEAPGPSVVRSGRGGAAR